MAVIQVRPKPALGRLPPDALLGTGRSTFSAQDGRPPADIDPLPSSSLSVNKQQSARNYLDLFGVSVRHQYTMNISLQYVGSTSNGG
jgi:hypothetical protein